MCWEQSRLKRTIATSRSDDNRDEPQRSGASALSGRSRPGEIDGDATAGPADAVSGSRRGVGRELAHRKACQRKDINGRRLRECQSKCRRKTDARFHPISGRRQSGNVRRCPCSDRAGARFFRDRGSGAGAGTGDDEGCIGSRSGTIANARNRTRNRTLCGCEFETGRRTFCRRSDSRGARGKKADAFVGGPRWGA